MQNIDPEILRHALVGYEPEWKKLNERIAEIKAMLAGHQPMSPKLVVNKPISQIVYEGSIKRKKRGMSAAGRKAVAEAQKKRWAKLKAEKKAKGKTAAA